MRNIYLFFLCIVFCMTGCVNDPELEGGIQNAKAPSVQTNEILKSTASSVTVSGEVLRENGAPVTEAGFCWSLESTFTLANDNKKAVSTRKRSYEATIENLKNDEDYYIRAYAINVVDTAYGEILPFKTADGLGSVKTIEPTHIKSTSAECGGVITMRGEAEVEKRGVYLMSSPEPSAMDSLIYIEMEADSFYCTITGLNPETVYYVRAFASNKYGEYNGAKIESFRTTNGFPVLDDDKFELVDVDYSYAEFSMVVANEGDAPVTACGFCFSERPSPTIENGDTIICGSGVGAFTGRIGKMLQQKGYYVRAFATNALGTVYSEGEGIHTVLVSELPTVSTKSVSNIRNGRAMVGGEVLDEGASPVSEAGICWGTDSNLSLENKEDSLVLSTGKGTFSGTISKLKGGQTYYLRAYAMNENGIAYGETITFQTPAIFGASIPFEGPSFLFPGSVAYCSMSNSSGFLLGGDMGAEYTNEFWRYMVSGSKWLPLKEQPEKLSGQACFSIGLGVWAFGGKDYSGKICDSLYVYSTSENSWNVVRDDSNRPKGMYRPAYNCMDNLAFLIGGQRGDLIDEVWVFESNTLTWTQKSGFPIKQYGGIAVPINGRLYAGLGIVNEAEPSPEYSKRLWSTDSEVSSWVEEKSLPEGCESIRCAIAYENRIYGVDGEGYIWCYDPDSREWSEKSRLPEENRTVHCMYALDGLIYIGLGTGANALISYAPLWDN